MNYYPHNITDYMGDTKHLSIMEHGAYRLLIDWYYLDEMPIPNDYAWIFRKLCAKTKAEQTSLKIVLSEFFVLEAEGFRHIRCDKEINIYKTKAEIAKSNGSKGGRPKRRFEDGIEFNPAISDSEPKITKPVFSGLAKITGSEANQEPRTKNQEPIVNMSATPLVTSPKSQVPVKEIIELFNQKFPELPQVQKITEKRTKSVKQRWLQNPKLQTIDSWARFFDYIRRSDFLMGRTPNPWHGFCFDWIFTDSNFTKILEGNYENKGAA